MTISRRGFIAGLALTGAAVPAAYYAHRELTRVDLPETPGGKLFFAVYGLYVGLVFVASIGLILAPVAHRLLHRFHCEE
jgi:hypothetical protein